MTVRVVVADQSEVRFYDLAQSNAPLVLAGRMAYPTGRLQNHELVSDRPDPADDKDPHRHEADVFARAVIRSLEHAQQMHRFDRLVLVAPPGFLGLLHRHMPAGLSRLVAEEIGKDLVHEPESALRRHLSAEVLRSASFH